TVQYAGTFSRQFGNDVKWRGLASISWGWQGIEALLTQQYIGHGLIPEGEGSPVAGTDVRVFLPNVWYTNFSVGYNLPTNTRIQAGFDNIFNRQPPILFQNNVVNANTDVNTYDVLGRRWFVS